MEARAKGNRTARRSGMVALVLVLVVLAILGTTVVAHATLTGKAHTDAVDVLIGENALGSCELAIGGMQQALARACVVATDPGFGPLRARLLGAPAGAAIDLTDLVAGAATPAALSWQRGASSATETVGTLRIVSRRCTVERSTPVADASGARVDGDERVAVVRFECTVAVRLAGHHVSRRLARCHELKIAVAGPPRPFDGLGLYVADLASLTDARAANRLRERLLALRAEAEKQLSGLDLPLSKENSDQLAAIAKSLPDLSGAAAVPALPEEPAAVIGLAEPKVIATLTGMDLAARLVEDVATVEQARERVRQACGSVTADGGDRLVEATTALARAFNAGLMRIWSYHRFLRFVPRTGQEFLTGIAPYEDRLSSSWYGSRTMLALPASSPVLAAWQAGKRELDGVVRISSAAPVALTGRAPGRAVVVIDAPEVQLGSFGDPRATDRSLVTIVIPRGRLVVSGTVRATIIAGQEARLTIAPGAVIAGSLLVRGKQTPGDLAGQLTRASDASAGTTIDAALALQGRGAYAVAVSPAPLWTEGDR